MTADFPCHAAQRAKERYGIDLTLEEVRDIARRCQKGEGRERTVHGGQHHSIVHGDRVLHVVWRPPDGTRHEFGEVVTILPVAAANAKVVFDGVHRIRRKRGFFPKRRR